MAAERYLLEVTIGRSTHDKLRYAQDLLGHELPSGAVAAVLDRALDALIEKLEKRKLAATTHPRPSARPSANPRHIPAHVKRAVWERDGGQCTFVSEAGRRCPARKPLEFDHSEEVACGGRASVAGIRLRCRAHNQYGAECTFGLGFMRQKREEARLRAEARRQETEARARARAAAEEVIAALRVLGFRAHEAQCAAALCEASLMPRSSSGCAGRSPTSIRGSVHLCKPPRTREAPQLDELPGLFITGPRDRGQVPIPTPNRTT